MSQFSPRNTPKLAPAGFQLQTLDAGSGAVLLSALLPYPNGSNSAWLQVVSGDALQWRLDGDTSGSDWFTADAGALIPLTNRKQLEALVLQSTGSTAVGVQYFEGAVGPMPPAPVLVAGGGGGGGGALTSLPTENAVHVMKNGDDATGQRGRLDLPFLSVEAAVAVVQPGDTLVIWPGTYTVTGSGIETTVGGYTVQLLGAVLEYTDTLQLVSMNTADDVFIMGEGVLRTTGTNVPVVLTFGGPTGTLYINGPKLETVDSTVVNMANGKAVLRCDIVQGGTGVGLLGNVDWQGNMIADGVGAQANVREEQAIRGTIVAGGAALYATGGSQLAYGSFTGIIGAWAVSSNGKQEVHGDLRGTQRPAALCESGNQLVIGNCLGEVEEGAYCDQLGTQEIHGTVTSFGSAAGATCSQDGNQIIHGTVVGQTTGALQTSTGRQYIYGTVDCPNDVALKSNAASGDGLQYFDGVMLGRQGTTTDDGGNQVINGMVRSIIFFTPASGGKLVFNARYHADAGIVVNDNGTLILGPSSVLVIGLSGPSLVNAGTTPRVTSLGAWANTAEDAGITVQGTFNVNALVQ